MNEKDLDVLKQDICQCILQRERNRKVDIHLLGDEIDGIFIKFKKKHKVT